MRGYFITFEGIEGCGKTTQSALLAARLRKAGWRVVLTREPGGTPLGERVRTLVKRKAGPSAGLCPEAEVLLFAASRAQLVRTVILPEVARGSIVISDRFMDSTSAYQGAARRLDRKVVDTVNRFVVDEAVPDLTILLDLDVAAGLRRMARRVRNGGSACDRIEAEKAQFHLRVRRGYLGLARRWPERIRVIRSSRPRGIVACDVWRAVHELVGSGPA